MKRLLVSALFISVFFIGISGLINGVSATFQSDAKALELVKAARIAIGGNQNIAAVTSMTIKGTTTHFFEKNGVQNTEQGNVEYNIELPGRMSKKVMIGTPGDGTEDAMVQKEIVVIKGDGDIPGTIDGNGNVFIIKKSDGQTVDWTSADGHDVKVEGGKIRIQRPDGTVEEVAVGDKHKVIVRTDGGDHDSDENEFVSDDGKRIRVEREIERGPRHGSNEMLRMTMALLMSAPDDGSVSYKFVGTGNVDGFASNIIEVEAKGSSFKLYLDAGSNLLQMISYAGHGAHRVMIRKMEGGEVIQENIVGPDPSGPGGMGENQIKFSDFRSVGSLILPHRWTEMSNGKSTQNIDITSFELNPADIADRFDGEGEGPGQRVVIRKRMQ